MGFSAGRRQRLVGSLDPVRFITGWGSTPPKFQFFFIFTRNYGSHNILSCIDVGTREEGGTGTMAPLFGQIVTLNLQLNSKKKIRDDNRFTKTRSVKMPRKLF